MGDRPKALPGDVPSRETPALHEHEWDDNTTATPDRFGTPGWLNSDGGRISKTCRRCGCEILNAGAIVHVDVKITKGQEYVYRTATGQVVRSFKPLSCPLFGFDAFSGAMEGKEIGRQAKIEAEKVDIRVDETQYRVRQMEAENRALHEATLMRIEQLEAENRALKARVGSVAFCNPGRPKR